MGRIKTLMLVCAVCFLVPKYSISQSISTVSQNKKHHSYFIDFIASRQPQVHKLAFNHIEKNWSENDEILLLETIYNLRSYRNSDKLLRMLKAKTGQSFGYDFNKWYEYIWRKPKAYNEAYFDFKAELHRFRDPKFFTYFKNRAKTATIRLDEVRWGGVLQDGIPPLRNPKMLSVSKAKYLDDSNIVFGVAVNGDFRAYPKRILAWHEMFTDTVGGIPVAGVYCTLCGTVILYKTQHKGTNHQLGTSGFLYRSNKLMYDKATQSLWSTSLGEPVIGPLVGKNIKLDYLSVVTTTWGEWRRLHPETKVLSLNTGHKRDYDEGIAYKSYFSTDELMFNTPKQDNRLKNKDEVLVIKSPKETDEVIAIASKFLKTKPIYYHSLNGKSFAVLTSKKGAHRTYYNENITFTGYEDDYTLIANDNTKWQIKEHILVNTSTGKTLERLHSYNAFWFGFFASHPEVQLIK